LYATYFEGCKPLDLGPDDEARDLPRAVGFPDHRIVAGDMKDNFWEMGYQGPCGPAVEIHYDRVGGRNAADLVNQDDPNVIETSSSSNSTGRPTGLSSPCPANISTPA